MSSTYIFKIYKDGQFVNQTNIDNSVSILQIDQLESWSFLKVSNIIEVNISKSTIDLLHQLLSKYKISNNKDFFLSLGINLQNAFVEFQNSFDDDILDDFKDEDNEYKKLLELLEKYYFQPDNKLHSISFKFQRDKTTSFKNELLVSEILKSIASFLNIEKAKFEERKTEIINNIAHIKKGKGGEFLRTQFINELHNFLLQQKIEKSNYSLHQFIGCYLHIFQIPYSSSITEIQIDSIEEELKSVDVKLMRHYFYRPKAIFYT